MKKHLLGFLLVSGLLFSGNIFAATPTVSSVTEVSTPLSTSTADGASYYNNGETIQFSVLFSEPVAVSGNPALQFRARNLLEEANYASGTGTNTLVFEYTVGIGINDWNGIVVEKFKNFTAGDYIESVSTNDQVVEDIADVAFSSLKIDGEAPIFSSLTNNTTDGTVVGPTRYLKQGDKIAFQVTLTKNDTWDSSGYIEYQIGSDAGLQDNFGNSATGQENSANATTSTAFLNGRDGSVQITDIAFVDKAGKAMTGALGTPIATNIIVDTTAPGISFSDDVAAGPVQSDDIEITVTDTNPDTTTYEYGFSNDAVCDGTDTYGNAFTSGASFTINTETNNGKYICAKATDLAGNISYQVGANDLNIDVTAPGISFSDDVAAGPVQSDDIEITVTDTNPDTTTYEYGFSSDAVCDGTDTYGNAFTSGASFTINTETNNGKYICAKATDLAGNISYQVSANDLNIDINDPTISFTDDVAAGPVSSDDIIITVTDNNPDTATYEYGFSNDAVCDGTDIYGNDFTSGASFTINTETNNGKYICAKATDLSGNISYQVSTNDLNIDATAPVFSSIGVVSNNTNTSYAKSGDTLTFTLTLNAADTSNGGTITFSIGSTTGLTASLPTGNSSTSHTATFVVGAQNGAISVTNITFEDKANNALTGFSGPATPSPTVTVDSTNPSVSFTDDVLAGPVQSDDIEITVTDTNPDTTTYEYGFSADSTCDGTDTYGNAFTSGGSFTINTETNNGKYICAKATDLAGNISYQVSANDLNIDATAPVFSAISASSNNPDPSMAKSGDTITFTLSLGAADTSNGGTITFDIGSTTGLTASLPAGNSSTSHTATFVVGAQNGAISVTNIAFQDKANNALTGFSGPATPSPTVLIDTTAPTLDSVSVSTTGNPGWARNNQYVNYVLTFSENIVRSALNSSTQANNASVLHTEFDAPSLTTTDNIRFQVKNGDNGTITIQSADFVVSDGAGNTLSINAGSINALVTPSTLIKADTTSPTISSTSITSNNSNDTSLAKTNDTITVNFTSSDNLSPTVSFNGTQHILNKAVTSSSIGAVGAGNFIARFTDGTETSETVVPFQFRIRDEAGNTSSYKTSTDDGSSVKFDRTNPVVRNVKISATSADSSAYTGDLPTYYAKQGDTITLTFEAKDYVEIQNNPTGTILGTNPTITKGASQGVDGNAEWFLWTAQITNIDGTEGTVAFDILVKDNAGNGDGTTNSEVHITGTTDGSKVIFDKTRPTLPTTVNDVLGAERTNFKQRDNAIFTWSGDADPNPSSADTVSGILKYLVRLTNPANGGEDHRGTATVPEEVSGQSFDGRTSNIPDPGQTKIPARDETDPYELRLIILDKSGNYSHGNKSALSWAHAPVYTQPYTIGISGYVFGYENRPIEATQVQVVARNGEVCDTGKEICTSVTDANGFYSIVLKKEQNYNISYLKSNYQLQKHERRLEKDDIEQDVYFNLVGFEEIQTSDQTAVITTTKKLIKDGTTFATQIFVKSLSGEIDAQYLKETAEIFISSLSRIASVSSNDPDVTITDNGNNTFSIFNAGKIFGAIGTKDMFTFNDQKLGIAKIPTGGKPQFTPRNGSSKTYRNKSGFWTREQVLEDNARINAGFKPQIITYTNTNGHEIFAGYRPGRLPISKLAEKRTTVRKIRSLEAFKNISQEKNYTHLSKGPSKTTKIERRVSGDEYKSVLARRDHLERKTNAFERKRQTLPKKSTMRHTYQSNPMIKIAGKALRMNDLVR